MKELGITKGELTAKFAKRIDDDQGYDNLGLAEDLVEMAESSKSELLERYNEAIEVLEQLSNAVPDDGTWDYQSAQSKAIQTISKANGE